jgi:hypothetical protein
LNGKCDICLAALSAGRHPRPGIRFEPRGRSALIIVLCAIVATPAPASGADLEPRTVDAFNRYVQITETEIDTGMRSGAPFLWIDRLPEGRRATAYADLRAGKAVIEKLETLENSRRIPVPGGMIHHWIGTVFIPGATLEETLALEEDYQHHHVYFAPDVIRSKILRHDGNNFTVLLRFYKKKVITTVTDTEHEVHYVAVDSTHVWSRSHTTRIQEVDNEGQPSERLEPEGHDHGFLWRMNTDWHFEQKDGGTYVESQSISLTRDIPVGIGWMIGPYVASVPRESLTFTLATTRSAVLGRMTMPAPGQPECQARPDEQGRNSYGTAVVEKVVAPRKTSGELLRSPGTRLLAEEMKLTVLPSPLIDGTMLLPFAGAGDAPFGWLANTVATVHVLVPGSVTTVPEVTVQVFRT